MTLQWKRIAVGSLVVAGIVAAGYLAWPKPATAAQAADESYFGGPPASMGSWHWNGVEVHDRELAAAADRLGITPADLSAALASGRGIADLAKEKGVDPAAVQEAVTAARKSALDELVASGRLTRSQADLMLNHMDSLGMTTLNAGSMMRAGGGCHGAYGAAWR